MSPVSAGGAAIPSDWILDYEVVKELVQPETPTVPSLKAFVPKLSDYNVLLEATA